MVCVCVRARMCDRRTFDTCKPITLDHCRVPGQLVQVGHFESGQLALTSFLWTR